MKGARFKDITYNNNKISSFSIPVDRGMFLVDMSVWENRPSPSSDRYQKAQAGCIRPEARDTVGRHRHLNLEDTPWPMSILKFNRALSEMKPGDDMTATISDADVITNLLQLLRHHPGVGFTVSSSGSNFCVEVKREEYVVGRGAVTDNRNNR